MLQNSSQYEVELEWVQEGCMRVLLLLEVLAGILGCLSNGFCFFSLWQNRRCSPAVSCLLGEIQNNVYMLNTVTIVR